MFTIRILVLCGILILSPQLRQCRKDSRKARAIDFPMQWRPVPMAPSAAALHMMPGGDQHLISITNFDSTNKAQLAQIAHHNAQILRHIKRVPGVPVTQYHNPFPMFGSSVGGGGGSVGLSISSGGSGSDTHQPLQSPQSSHQIHHHHHPSAPGPGKHFIVQTSNVVVHPPPAPPSAIGSITSAPLVHPHPNSLLTSSSNMAQTMVPYGHHHKHQYYSAKHPPAFLLSGKQAELNSAGASGAYKFLNAIHPSTVSVSTTTASGAKSNYATAALIKSGAVSIQPMFSSTTSRIPIIRTSKPHPVVGKLQSHLALATRPKPGASSLLTGPGGPHSLDELSAHQSHLISSLAQFGAPNFVRTASAAAGDTQQKLPRPNQGPPFAPMSTVDHVGHFLGKNYATQVRFPQMQSQLSGNSAFGSQQQQLRAQSLQHQHHQQQQQQLQQQHQQQQQHQTQLIQQDQLRQQQQQQHQQQEQQHQFQQQQKQQFQQQQNAAQQAQQAAQQAAYNNQQQQQSQHEETFYMPPANNEHTNNHTKPVFEPNQSLEQVLRDFDLPFKQMPSFAESPTTRSPNAYLPPSSLPSISPSVLSPFFQQTQQQQQKHEHSENDSNEHHFSGHQHHESQHSHESSHSDGFHANHPADLLPHFFISSTFAPSPQIHHVQIQPTADDYLPNNLSYHHSFPTETITYHHQQIDTPSQQHHVPPFTRLEDEFTLNLVPPPSYAKDTSQFRNRPPPSRGPPSTAFPHVQQHSYQQHSAEAAADQVKALDILNKYNIPAISPLQDANRFAYNAVNIGQHHNQQKSKPSAASSSLAPSPSPAAEFPVAHPTGSSAQFTTEKPNVFRYLNRPAESEYKHHKVMHPSYTGGPKRPANNTGALNNSPDIRPEIITAAPTPSGGSSAVTHSFFTIEDAVTLSPQLNSAHRNGGVRPTATNNQIEASLNRPHEEEITEVITMRATSEDDELLQHLDVSSTPVSSPRVPMRTKHRRRRPRPSSTSTSTSTTERRPDEDTMDDDDEDEHRQSNADEQGHWETNRFPSNHRETPEPTTSTRGTTSTASPPQPNNSRHRTRTRGGANSGRPTVTNLHDGIVLEKPTRSRRPTQRPDDTPPAATSSRTRSSSSTYSTGRTTVSSAETTENYDEPTTMNLRDNIFLANLKHRRRPPHSTKATSFVSSTQPPTLATESQSYGRGGNGPQQTIAAGFVTEIGEDTFMTTRATKPAFATQQTNHHYVPALTDNSVQSTYEFEEITLASDIAQTVSTQVTVAPTVLVTADDVDTTVYAVPATTSSSTTSTTVNTQHTESPAPPPTSHQTQYTVVEQPAVETSMVPAAVAPTVSHRHRHRLRPKDHHKQISHNEIHASTTEVNSNGMDEQDVVDIVTPTRFSAHPVSVRLPNIKSTSGNTPFVAFDSTTTRTTISVDDTSMATPTGKNNRSNGAVIQKFDPKNRPRFSVKDYRQRLISTPSTNAAASETSSTVSSTTPTSTTRLRYPTRSRVLPDLKIKANRNNANSMSNEEQTNAAFSTERHYDDSASSSSTTTTEETARKRFVPKDRRNKSTASNEVLGGSSERTTAYSLPTPASTSYPSRGTTTSTAPTTARTTRTRNPTSRRSFSSSTTASPTLENTVTRVPTIRKYAGGPSLRRPPQPSLRQRIAISQQKKASTEATMAAASTLAATVTASAVQTTTPGSINKLFNVDESENAFTPSVDNLDVDDIDMSDSVNTENYKLETAIMKIAKDDHSYRPYAHSSITPRSRSRTTSTTESMFFDMDSERADDTGANDEFPQNQLSSVDMNGSPSEHSERVADLTRFGTNHFKSVNTASGSATSRRIPGYFTLATEDPILPIEAFFPKMSNGNSMRG